MIQWEYIDFSKQPYDNVNVEDNMISLGKEGWECYAVIYAANIDMTRFYFKRPLPQPTTEHQQKQ
jgi:hypothetical protein